MEGIRNIMKQKFEERFNIRLKPGTLTKKEKELTKTLLPKYYSDEWVYR
jgi:lipoate-protein ligase A